MSPERVSRALTYAGIIGFVIFFFGNLPFGSTLAVSTLVSSAVMNYSKAKPFVIPLFAVINVLLILTQLLGGQLVAALLGTALGLGLPYGVYALKR